MGQDSTPLARGSETVMFMPLTTSGEPHQIETGFDQVSQSTLIRCQVKSCPFPKSYPRLLAVQAERELT
jgi:hypothetical protein